MLYLCVLTAPVGVVVADTQQDPMLAENLVLNGVGTRRLVFAKLYTCRLFLPRQVSSYEAIAGLDGPIELHLEVHGEPPGTLPKEWAEVLDEELSKRLFRKTKRHYRQLSAGDRVIVAYVPGIGTEVWLNGEKEFTDAGRGLIQALLDQWMGERPVSHSLRRGLLGQSR